MLMEMARSRSCRGSAFHEDGPDEQNAQEPSVEVDVRGTNSLWYVYLHAGSSGVLLST